MNTTQVTTTLAPIIAFFAGLLAGKGVFGLDAATWTTILGGLVSAIATVWVAIVTRNSSVIQQAAALPEVKAVITDTKTAEQTLSQVHNVVSTAEEAKRMV